MLHMCLQGSACNGAVCLQELHTKPTAAEVAPVSTAPASVQLSLADIRSAIVHIVTDLTGSAVAVDRPLAAQGLDSLASMELRQKLQVGLFSFPFPYCMHVGNSAGVLHAFHDWTGLNLDAIAPSFSQICQRFYVQAALLPLLRTSAVHLHCLCSCSAI